MAYLNSSNLCIFEGRVTSNQMKETYLNGQNGQVLRLQFSIAVPKQLSSAQRQKAKNDNTIKTVDFVNCVALGPQAESVKKYFVAGKAIRVIASYATWEGTDQNSGQKTYGHNFEVVDVSFCSSDAQNVGQNNNGNSNSGYNNGGNNNGYSNGNNGHSNNSNNGSNNAANSGNFEMWPDENLPF